MSNKKYSKQLPKNCGGRENASKDISELHRLRDEAYAFAKPLSSSQRGDTTYFRPECRLMLHGGKVFTVEYFHDGSVVNVTVATDWDLENLNFVEE